MNLATRLRDAAPRGRDLAETSTSLMLFILQDQGFPPLHQYRDSRKTSVQETLVPGRRGTKPWRRGAGGARRCRRCSSSPSPQLGCRTDTTMVPLPVPAALRRTGTTSGTCHAPGSLQPCRQPCTGARPPLTSGSPGASVSQDPTTPSAGVRLTLCSTGAAQGTQPHLSPLLEGKQPDPEHTGHPSAPVKTAPRPQHRSGPVWALRGAAGHAAGREESPSLHARRHGKAAALRAQTGRGRTWSGL